MLAMGAARADSKGKDSRPQPPIKTRERNPNSLESSSLLISMLSLVSGPAALAPTLPLAPRAPTAASDAAAPQQLLRAAPALVHMSVQNMEGTGPETANKVFDPLGFANASPETLAWYRHAEIKHGRVAMAALTGWAWVSSGGPLFPGYLSIQNQQTFESLGRDGYGAWAAVPTEGKLQIIGTIAILEILSEATCKPHYMAGGTPGKIPLIWDPAGFTKNMPADKLARKRLAELKNGRLAMIGVMSLVAAHFVPGSVPALP